MASREHQTTAQPWGTLEELLLVCAVNRHGTNRWDSVASELQSRRTSSSSAAADLTPHDCSHKFDGLRRRFQNDAAESKHHDENGDGLMAVMVDELRRLRVDELRREVRRRDVSIVSLELQVKKMEEDRDRSLKASAADDEDASPSEDLHRGGGGADTSELPENLAGKSNSGEDFVSDSSERENRSFNESNSTSQRSELRPNGVVEKKADDDVEPGPERSQSDPAHPQTRSGPASANGGVIDVDNNNKNGGSSPPSRLGEPNESSGAKRAVEMEVRKQNSDVQSSASLSRKRKRRRKGGDSSSGEEPEGGEEVSPATTKRVKLVKLEPLVKVLRLVRSHQLGSVFQRRLRSQESQRYKNLIREHVDLRVVQSRLDKGVYNDCTPKFFRDLLLIFNNAVVFFRKAAPEHVAALELRSLVLKEMNDQLPTVQPDVNKVKPKPNVESDITTTTTSIRPCKSSLIVVCGKRGSINALSENKKGSVSKVEVEEKEAKGKVNEKKVEDIALVKVDEKGVRKRRSTQEKKGGRRSRTTTSNSKNMEAKVKSESGGNEMSTYEGLEVVTTEKKEEKKEDVKKKQGAASFLKRIKQNGRGGVGGGSNGSDVSEDESKDSMVDEDEEEVEEEEEEKKKKTGRKKTDQVEKKSRVTRSSNGNRGRRGGRGQESSARGKRGVGRPPKKPESAAAGSGKRGRDNGEVDQVGSAGRPRKRTRR